MSARHEAFALTGGNIILSGARVVTHSLNAAPRTSSVGSRRFEQMYNTNSTTRPYLSPYSPQRQEIDVISATAAQREHYLETPAVFGVVFRKKGGRNRI